MYQIVYENEVIGYTDEPIYIRNKNGVWVNCKPKEAEGIAYNSIAYVGAHAWEFDSYKVITESSAALERTITDIEISQIEDEQMLTDHDIAILELQNKEA